ncbi:MAG: AraC family transcriptional regulator [Xanthomonadales bacterium]|nr:AraC family transcriptional regulator [Xanthomonadales bacterium]
MNEGRQRRLAPQTYFGDSSREFSVSGRCYLRESNYAQDSALPLHSHEHLHFCYVISGRYEEEVEGRGFQRQPGELMVYPAGASHAEQHRRKGRHLILEVHPALARGAADGAAVLNRPGSLEATPLRRGLLMRLRHELRQGDALSAEVFESLLLELLADCGPVRERLSDAPRWIGTVVSKLRRTYGDPAGLDALADEAGVHPVYLARRFREATGCSIGEFTRNLRLSHAQQLLAESGMSLAEIALEAGFFDQSHFCRVFKSQIGMTPGAYRRNARV